MSPESGDEEVPGPRHPCLWRVYSLEAASGRQLAFVTTPRELLAIDSECRIDWRFTLPGKADNGERLLDVASFDNGKVVVAGVHTPKAITVAPVVRPERVLRGRKRPLPGERGHRRDMLEAHARVPPRRRDHRPRVRRRRDSRERSGCVSGRLGHLGRFGRKDLESDGFPRRPRGRLGPPATDQPDSGYEYAREPAVRCRCRSPAGPFTSMSHPLAT